MNEDRFEAEHGDMLNALREARGDCPPADRLLDWIEGTLDGETAAYIEAHVALCTQCAEAAQRARDADPEIDELSWRRTARNLEAREAPWRQLPRRARPAWLAAAAAAVVALGIVLVYWQGPEESTVSPPVATVRSADIELIEPVGKISDFAAFRWRGVPAPVRYRVEVAEAGDTPETAEPIWARVTPDTRLPFDQDVTGQLAPGRVYRWRVVVLDAEGEVLSRSDWVTFELEG